jgi:murein DD-endopeptidase MepM/ murein hydrolase activator NlpD
MWLYLRNILVPEAVLSTNTNPSPDLKRTSPMGVAARVIMLSSALAATLGASVESRAVPKPPGQASVPGPSQPAAQRLLPGAQSSAPDGTSRLPAFDRPVTSVMQMAFDGLHNLPLLRDDLHSRPTVVLSLDEPVLVKLCWLSPSVCAPPAIAAGAHEWTGRVAVGTSKTVTLADGSGTLVADAAHPTTLSGVAPLEMPPAQTNTYAGEIKGGLHAAWTPVGLPAGLVAQLSRLFAGRLDATQPAQAGDYYRIAYERVDGKPDGAAGTRITAVELRLAGQIHRAVWFVAPGRVGGEYYSFDGERLTAEPFAMPLNYVRVSSPFGYRIHPVTGQHLLHTGVDLTAAPGTPVAAASAGTVQFVGYDSGYGNHVVLRHPQGYTSYYAHLSAFAKGLRAGMQVSQGQSLGAVGETGVATGPHLHFEVRLNNQPTDPLKLTSRSSAVPLAGRQRAAFDQLATIALAGLPALPGDVRTAATTPFPVH